MTNDFFLEKEERKNTIVISKFEINGGRALDIIQWLSFAAYTIYISI